jgi:hypothetical protein
MTPLKRAELLLKIRAEADACGCLAVACARYGVSESTYARWSARYAEAGMDGLEDLPRSGRPPSVRLTDEEGAYLRKVYLKSNLREGAGSMSLAARWAAKNPDSPLQDATREAILRQRASKHLLPVEVRRVCRASTAEVARYRDAKSGLNDGLYTPGWLRMAADGSRRLLPGERQVWDDASVNVGVYVPWARGGDRCSDRFGCRVARFQLLAGLDCATDLGVGYSYCMRMSDGYGAEDVVSGLHRVWQLNGYAPHECVMEGGAWQAARTLGFLGASGVQCVSAKGRPNQKLIEGWFNSLWTVMSVELGNGQIGRFRGEMAAENTDWRRCREGVANPKDFFPSLTEFLSALDRSIQYRNSEVRESRDYGRWVPAEAYAAAESFGHPLPQGLRRYALPVREARVLRRQGMVMVAAADPFGYPHRYAFASEDGAMFDGAPVIVSFDPLDIEAGAVIELADNWHDLRKGRIIDAAAPCVSPAPTLLRTNHFWTVATLDPRAAATAEKRASRAKVGAQVAAFDARGVKARHAEHEGEERFSFGAAAPAIPEPAEIAEPDWAAMESAAGVLVS